jgi:16S rRNA (cytidine1402-2'-O)-methyltransferase
MASGMNGQKFTFHGYLPVQPGERKASIKEIESIAKKTGYTQIFMETPYRNMALFTSLMETCYEDSRLCIACDISLEREFILTQRIKEWKKERVELNKRPCIFMIG